MNKQASIVRIREMKIIKIRWSDDTLKNSRQYLHQTTEPRWLSSLARYTISSELARARGPEFETASAIMRFLLFGHVWLSEG